MRIINRICHGLPERGCRGQHERVNGLRIFIEILSFFEWRCCGSFRLNGASPHILLWALCALLEGTVPFHSAAGEIDEGEVTNSRRRASVPQCGVSSTPWHLPFFIHSYAKAPNLPVVGNGPALLPADAAYSRHMEHSCGFEPCKGKVNESSLWDTLRSLDCYL